MLAILPTAKAQVVANLVQNPSFEQDEPILDDPAWAAWCTWNPAEGAGSNATIVSTQFTDGARSLMIEPRGGTDWYFIVLQDGIPLEVGRTYTTSFWARAAAPRPISVTMKASDNSATWGWTQFQLTTEWAQYSFSAPAGNASAKLEFHCAATNDAIWLDLVSVSAEGAGPAPLVANGSFEEDEPILDDPDWQAWCTWNAAEGAGSKVTIVTTEAIDGARSLRIEPKGTENWHFIVTNISFPLTVGANATATFWAKAEAPRPLAAQMKAADNSVTWGYTDFQLTTEWAQYTMTSPAGSNVGKIEFLCAGVEVPFWLDLVSVTVAEEPAPLVLNGSFEEDEVILNDEAYDHWWTWGYETGLSSTAETDQAIYVDGTRSLRIVPRGDTNWYFIVAYSPILVEVGKNYTIDFWAKAEAPRPLTAQLKATDNSINAWGATEFQLTTDWAEYHYQSEVLINSVKLEFLCAGSEVPFWLDFVSVYEGEYVPGAKPEGAAKAGAPSPADGAKDVLRDVTLSWISGSSAVTHRVYFGTDFNDVNNADSTDTTGIYRGSQARGTMTYKPAESPLKWDQAYYWRVDEVNEADPNSPWKGNIWSFTTTNYVVVDDFESYNDIEAGQAGSKLIYQTWSDGFGTTTNGSSIGYTEPFQPTMESKIVHGGKQSVPLAYDNSKAGLSEVTRTLNADWTRDEVLTLTLFYKGRLSNDAEPMYVALNGTAITHDNPQAARAGGWTQWDILLKDFADLGVNLAKVDTISIGFGNKAKPVPGGSGHVLIDDVRLYRSLPVKPEPRPEPVNPGTTNLVASYSFENNADDGSGKGLNGFVRGNPAFVEGIAGKALSFDGVNDYVDLGNNAAFDITGQITLSAWVKPEDAGNGEHNPFVTKGDHTYAIKHASSNAIQFFIYDAGWHTADVKVDSTFNGDWHHVLGTYDGNEVKTYVDGILGATVAHKGSIQVQTHNASIATNSEETDRFYYGVIDEVRIYNRALSASEIRFLVGN